MVESKTKEWIVTDPSGKEHVVTAPIAAKEEQVLAYARRQFSGQAPTEELGFFERQALPGGMISPEVLSTVAGGMGGAAIGSAFAPGVGTFLGGLLGAGAGAMGGRGYEMSIYGTEGKNPIQEIGEASQRGMIGQAAGEIAGKAIPAAVRGLARRLPGSQAARVELGIDRLKSAVNELMPKASSSELRAAAMRHADKSVPMAPVYDTLTDIVKSAKGASTPDTELLGVAQRLAEKINQSGNKLSLAEVQRELSDIGDLVGNLRSQGKNVSAQFSRIFASIAKQMEKMPEGKALREVATLYRKEQAVSEILEEVNKVLLQKRGSGTIDINANRFVKALERKPFVTGSFEPDELKDVMKIAQELIEMPAIPAPKGSAAGAGRVLAAPTAAYGAESVLSLPSGSISGPAALLSGGAELLRILLPTKRGRTILKKMLETGPLTPAKIAALVATARGITGQNLPPFELE